MAGITTYLSARAGYKREAGRQHSMFKKLMPRFIREARAAEDGSVTERDLHRVTAHATRVPLTLGATYALLRGTPLTDEERICQTLLGGLTPICHDYFDRPELCEERLLKSMGAPLEIDPESAHEWIYIRFMRILPHLVPDIDTFYPAFREVYRTQLATRQQGQKNLSYTDLKGLFYDQGSAVAHLARTLVRTPIDEAELAAVQQWGWVLQLVDDTMNLHKDQEAGRQTVATTADNITAYTALCHEEFRELAKRVRALGRSKAQTERILGRMLLVLARGLSMLQQLQQQPKAVAKPSDLAMMRAYLDFKW